MRRLLLGWLGLGVALAGCREERAGREDGARDAVGGEEVSTPGEDAAGADAATEDAVSEDAAGADAAGTPGDVPLVEAALSGKCPAGSKLPDNGVGPGNDLHKVTLDDYPDAVCNDGTPAIMYVRRAASAATLSTWVIHLQAGGSCQSWEVCRDRWCSFGTTYNAAKMSSRFAPEVANGSGLLSRGRSNALGDANQVYVYYCSSDQWLGQKDDHVFTDPSGAGPSFRVHFRGFSIVEAVNAALNAGVSSDDGAETLPPLADATRILFAGSSAGSAGQTHILDWWAGQYPEAETFGFFDASTDPFPEDIPNATFAAQYEGALPVRYQQTFVDVWDAHLDESCVAAHPGEDVWRCSLGSFVRLNHITTPFFVRQDLRDPVSFKALGEAGLAIGDYARAVSATMARYATLRSEASEREAMTRDPGVHVSNCEQHIVALNPVWFGIGATPATVRQGNGEPISVHDALAAWIEGAEVSAIDTHPSTTSRCAATTDDQ